jgi:hypothetical protein
LLCSFLLLYTFLLLCSFVCYASFERGGLFCFCLIVLPLPPGINYLQSNNNKNNNGFLDFVHRPIF